jgi:uncharacterized protein
MFDESLAINISEENCPVTAVISHVVRPGREQGYEAWFHGIAAGEQRDLVRSGKKGAIAKNSSQYK